MENQNNGVDLLKKESIEQTELPVAAAVQTPVTNDMKFCKFCGGRIPMDAVLCTVCGRQIEQFREAIPMQQPQIVINNANNNVNTNAAVSAGVTGKKKSKWVCFLLWLFLGLVGAHKFYDGRIGTGIIYILTLGGFGIGWLIDFFRILNKPNPYYV